MVLKRRDIYVKNRTLVLVTDDLKIERSLKFKVSYRDCCTSACLFVVPGTWISLCFNSCLLKILLFFLFFFFLERKVSRV